MDAVDKFNGTTYLLVGGSGSGKSNVLKHVFLNHVFLPKITPTKKDYIVVLFTKSEMSDALEGICKHVEVAPELDADIIKWAREMQQTYGKEKYSFVFVLDDCIHIYHNRVIDHCFKTFRNWGITSIISLQYAKDIPRSIRGTVYFAILMHCGKDSAIACVESFISTHLPGNNLNDKVDSLMEQTRDFCSFFIDNLSHKVYRVDKHYNCTLVPSLYGDICGRLEKDRDAEADERPDPSSPSVVKSLKDYLHCH